MKRFLPAVLAAAFLAGGLRPAPLIAEEGPRTSSADKASPEQPARRPKTWRALVEQGILFSASSIQYLSNYDDFTVDWQFTWATFGQKFFTSQSPRFDSNAFWYNWSHAGAGAGYYTMARTNGLNSRWSFLFSLASSSVWETVIEWRELISINDMLFTSFGGPAIGESLYQVGSYFSHRKGFWSGLAGFVFNPFLFVNNWFDRSEGRAANSAPDPDWHRFTLYAGLKQDKVGPAGSTAAPVAGVWYEQFHFGADMETGNEAGPSGALSDTLSSRSLLDASFASAGLEEIRIRTSAVLFGHRWSSVGEEPDGALRGGSVTLGYGTAFEMDRKRKVAWYDSNDEVEGGLHAPEGDARLDRPVPTLFTDKLGVISPAGGVLILSRFAPRFHARWASGVYADFAMVNSLPYNTFTESHDTSGVKTTLLNWGYYYGWGLTLTTDAAVDWGPWHVRGAAGYQAYASIQGLDRYQYQGLIADDFKLRDSRLAWRLSLGYRLPRTPIELGFAAEGITRRGELLDLSERYTEQRFLYELRAVF